MIILVLLELRPILYYAMLDYIYTYYTTDFNTMHAHLSFPFLSFHSLPQKKSDQDLGLELELDLELELELESMDWTLNWTLWIGLG
jgi:hypothetical protein